MEKQRVEYETMIKRDNIGRFVKGTEIPKTAFKKGMISWLKNTKGLVKPNKGSFFKGQIAWNKNKSPSKESRLKMSLAQKGRKAPFTAFKKGNIAPMKGKHNYKIMKENHWAWKGGIYPKHLAIRKSLEYRLWRDAVFKRDNYTCQECGDNRGHNLNADHIKPFALFPELRLDIDNGRTLCVGCHKKTDTYGRKVIGYLTKKNLCQLQLI